jgi:hypothetical protein
MKLFCIDLHISVIEDFRSLNIPGIKITDWCLSGHGWVLGKTQVNPSTWKNLSSDMIDSFQSEYDEFLRTFDGFIVGHPNGFAMVFEKYQKPIIMINSCRYDMPFCFSKNLEMLALYKDCLTRLWNKNLLLAVSNSRADQHYTLKGCGLTTHYLPSICLYTKATYNPIRSTFLCYTGQVVPSHPLITHRNEISYPYQWRELGEFQGIIHLPYEISTMSMFEHFTMGTPLFFPSKEFWKQQCPIISVSAYWGGELPTNLKEFEDPSVWIERADAFEAFKYVDDRKERKERSERVERVRKEWEVLIEGLCK